MEWFTLVKDNEGHDYVIPATMGEDWDRFVESEDEELPYWAEMLNGPIVFNSWTYA